MEIKEHQPQHRLTVAHIKYLHGVNLLVSLSILKFSRMEPLSIPSTFLKKGRICLVAITEREEDLGHTTPETNQRPWRRISLKRILVKCIWICKVNFGFHAQGIYLNALEKSFWFNVGSICKRHVIARSLQRRATQGSPCRLWQYIDVCSQIHNNVRCCVSEALIKMGLFLHCPSVVFRHSLF